MIRVKNLYNRRIRMLTGDMKNRSVHSINLTVDTNVNLNSVSPSQKDTDNEIV